MRNAHKKFIAEYLKTFNGSEAYRRVYGDVKNPNDNAARLMAREDIKSAINSRVAELAHITKEDYVAETRKLMNECKNESVRARYWQILGQASDILRENTQTITTNVLTIDELNALAKDKKAKAEIIDTMPVDKPVDNT